MARFKSCCRLVVGCTVQHLQTLTAPRRQDACLPSKKQSSRMSSWSFIKKMTPFMLWTQCVHGESFTRSMMTPREGINAQLVPDGQDTWRTVCCGSLRPSALSARFCSPRGELFVRERRDFARGKGHFAPKRSCVQVHDWKSVRQTGQNDAH